MVDKNIELSNLIAEIGKKMKMKMGCDFEEYAPDLSLKDLQVIEFIAKDKKTMGEIAEGFDLTPGTITPLVDKLVELGYLVRARDEAIDRRKVFISLSPKGLKLEVKLAKHRTDIADLILKGMNNDEKGIIIGVFAKMLDNLSDDEKNK